MHKPQFVLVIYKNTVHQDEHHTTQTTFCAGDFQKYNEST